MYIVNGIAYAGESKPQLKICGIRPMDNYILWIRFNTGEARLFNFNDLLKTEAFAPLKNEAVWRSVYIDYGIPMWNDGEIDIAPEMLYEKGISTDN